MDGNIQVVDVVAPVTTTGVVIATVPASGLNMTISIALAVLAGLIAWGLVYLFHYHMSHHKGSIDR